CRAALATYPGTRRAASSSPVGLAPGEVYPAGRVTAAPGGLLHHRFTLTGPRAGGLLSVALSRGLLRVGVTHRPALWSPDVPRRARARRDRLADPFAGVQSTGRESEAGFGRAYEDAGALGAVHDL